MPGCEPQGCVTLEARSRRLLVLAGLPRSSVWSRWQRRRRLPGFPCPRHRPARQREAPTPTPTPPRRLQAPARQRVRRLWPVLPAPSTAKLAPWVAALAQPGRLLPASAAPAPRTPPTGQLHTPTRPRLLSVPTPQPGAVQPSRQQPPVAGRQMAPRPSCWLWEHCWPSRWPAAWQSCARCGGDASGGAQRRPAHTFW